MSTRTNTQTWLGRSVLALGLYASACSNDVVVQIGNRKVDKKEFAAYLAHRRIPTDDPKRLTAALDEYAQRTALATAIEHEKLLDQRAVQVELEEMKKELLISRYFEKLLAERVGDDAVRNYYDSHAREYEERKVHVAHVLVRTSERMDETERKARLTRIQEAYAKLKAGEDFAQIASVYSEDRISAPRGGDLGWIKEGAIDARVSQQAFATQAGTLSEPFLSQFGYHIVRVIEGPQLVKRPFEAVAGDIRYQLRQRAKEAETKRLANAVDVETRPAVLKTLVRRRSAGDRSKLSARK